MVLFSERQGFIRPKTITIRDGLPVELRIPIYDIMRNYLPARFLSERVQALLNPYGIESVPRYTGPLAISKDEDDSNLINFKRALLGCEWFQVYDLLEDAFAQLEFHEEELASRDDRPRALPLQSDLNDYFIHAGIGWQMTEGKIITRQDEPAENAIRTAITELNEGGRPTAALHIGRAIRALSERPRPNTTGAVSHATNSIECVLNNITGESLTLGKYLDRHPKLFHPALKKALEGVYGFASDAGARHGKEGVEPDDGDAQFVVTTCAAACTLLNQRPPKDAR
jgi:hypothetical protein